MFNDVLPWRSGGPSTQSGERSQLELRPVGGGLQSDVLFHLARQGEEPRALSKPEDAVEVIGVGMRP